MLHQLYRRTVWETSYRGGALCSDTMDAEAIETSKDDLVREVELFNLEMTKLIALQRNLEVQAKRNQLAEIAREQEIKEAQEQTRKSRELANKSIQRSNCLSEYESLARVIYENHPTSSTELQTQIDEIRSEISKLEDEIASKDETLRIREAQYRSLIQSMLDLKQTLMEDEENKNLEGGDSKSMESRNADRPQPMETDDLYGDLL